MFPEANAVPPGLNFQDMDEDLPIRSIDRNVFVDWLTEGQHDCDVARVLSVTWSRYLNTSSNETLDYFFDSLLVEYEDQLGDPQCDGTVAMEPDPTASTPWC